MELFMGGVKVGGILEAGIFMVENSWQNFVGVV